jgi:parvulin-like peptidyl-prolyl isomerase
MISLSRHANRDEAYNALAALGNRVLAGEPLAEVAKSASEGATARKGGQWDWTQKGSLSAENLDQAIFSQPVGQLSPHILEAADGFHIIRVVERQELTRTSFEDAQKKIKEKIKQERAEKRLKDFVDELRKKYPVWTVFDNSLQQPKKAEDEDRYSTR